ncbi:FAD-binding oxidoreductase [Halomonas sp. M1]|uniref:FAD-binding oxidoreductase n=1 Tax=Halomonas sp. M1 TaxID=3035470 RepID=UPI002485E526|nr:MULTISPECIES: FAD-binding oxidoreductase [unclassified Halomonas]MDP3534019.1 FAD-binding oxidoreductase [Halomonas sp.]WFE70143.1 FAD-binding oxidoreductase [Halomonas sp. M1]
MDKLLNDLLAIVGPAGVLVGDDVSQRSVDWFTGAPCRAKAIVRPRSTEQLSRVMAVCYQADQPVVTHGGMTGIVHGGVASPEELVVSLELMNQIEEVDAVGSTIQVQAGVTLQRVQEAAEEIDMQFPLDLGARGSCTIGGNIATNAGGIRVIRYGMMRQQVLGLEAVLSDGTVVSSLNKMLKNNAGYDLKQLFIGSEGTLGIVTRAVLRLQPHMPSEQTALVAVPSFDALTQLLKLASRELANSLSAFEALWNNHYTLMTTESGKHAPVLADDSPFYAIIETLGLDEAQDAEHFSHVLQKGLEAGLITDAVLASSHAQRNAIWAIREDIEVLVNALKPMFSFDVSLPIPNMDAYVDMLEENLKTQWPEASKIVVFGHLGDGNLHIMITVRDDSPHIRRQVEELVYTPLKAFGGSISAEHGVGLEKKDYLSVSRTREEIALMKRLKTALDPKGLLNPGKVVALD